MICDYKNEEILDTGGVLRTECIAKAEIGSLCYQHAYFKLQAENNDMKERLETIKQLSDMYIPLLGTKKEAPWVRTMMSINGQAIQALKGEVKDGTKKMLEL